MKNSKLEGGRRKEGKGRRSSWTLELWILKTTLKDKFIDTHDDHIPPYKELGAVHKLRHPFKGLPGPPPPSVRICHLLDYPLPPNDVIYEQDSPG